MSASRRRPQRPSRKSPPSAPDDLPELEPVDDADLPELPELEADDDLPELPTLEEADEAPDSPIRVRVEAAAEAGFDTVLEVEVPALEKSAIGPALRAPLDHAARRSRAELRHRKVLVRFAGDALIGSAIKDQVAEQLRDVRPVLVVVRRGYGDETVLQGKAPRLATKTSVEGDRLRVEFDAGELEPEDLDALLPQELAAIAGPANGKLVEVVFTAGPVPNRKVRARIGDALREAGARSAVIGKEVLFDRAIEDLLRVSGDADGTRIEVQPGAEDRVLAAIDIVVPRSKLSGRVRLRFPSTPPPSRPFDRLVELCLLQDVARVELERDGDVDVVWPALFRVETGGGDTTVHVLPGERSPSMVFVAFRREATMHQQAVSGQHVTIDWPAGTALDDAIVARAIDEVLLPLAPRAIVCTIAGDAAEPFLPVPLQLATAGDRRELRLDTEAGRPADLVRAVQRRVPTMAGELRGRDVVIALRGGAAPSRTLLRAVREAVEGAGARRITIDDHGRTDVIVPPLLSIAVEGESVRVAGDAGGRSEAEVEAALARELDAAGLPADAACAVAPGPLADRLVAAVVARGASRVVLTGDEPVQVHPALFGAPERDGDRVVLFVEPGDDDALVAAQVARELPPLLAAQTDLSTSTVVLSWPGADVATPAVARAVQTIVAAGPARLLLDDGAGEQQVHPEIVPDYVLVLGKKDDATPPLTMLAIDAGTTDEHRARVLEKLAGLGDLLTGRRVLLVPRAAGREVAVVDDDPLLAEVRAAVETSAAATLVFRGRDERRRPFFEVVQSSVEGLAVGSRFADPRPARR